MELQSKYHMKKTLLLIVMVFLALTVNGQVRYDDDIWSGRSLFSLLVFIGFGILVFIACRAISLWYWKIEERLTVMQNQLVETKIMSATLDQQKMLLIIMADSLSKNKVISVKDRTTGNVRTLTLAQWMNDYKTYQTDYDFEIVDKA